jgi:hypothetical protein
VARLAKSPLTNKRRASTSAESARSRLRRLEIQVGTDPYLSSVEHLARRLSHEAARVRISVAKMSSSILGSDASRRERDRVAAVKTLIATLPESATLIQRWIQRRNDDMAEVHFTIFCFLDVVQELPSAARFRREIPKLLFEYLTTAKSRRGNAAWMAGHLLGDHWDARESLPILLEILRAGRFAAGRGAAIMGLQELYRRADVTPSDRRRIAAALDEVSRGDRSRKLRSWASSKLMKR